MSFSIQTDLSGLAIYLAANRHMSLLSISFSKLASGFRINSAADGPAQLVISENLRSQIGSLNQRIENTTMQIAKYSTASSTLMELRSQLTEMRMLAVGAANEGLNDETTQAAYNSTAGYLVETYNRTLTTADYNGHNLLDGTEGSVTAVTTLDELDLTTAESAQASIVAIDEAITDLDRSIIDVGAAQKYELESTRSSLEITRQNLVAAESQIRDTDYLKEISIMMREQIQLQATLSLMAHNRFNASIILGMFQT